MTAAHIEHYFGCAREAAAAATITQRRILALKDKKATRMVRHCLEHNAILPSATAPLQERCTGTWYRAKLDILVYMICWAGVGARQDLGMGLSMGLSMGMCVSRPPCG